ncbi:MAG: RagB/SusD family nutrient uptake outer membrane protein [Gemmatimonadota bacterium]
MLLPKSSHLIRAWMAAVALALPLTGCGVIDDILTVDIPAKVIASDLENPAAAALLTESVRNEFRCTFTHYAVASGLTGMEFADAVNSASLTIWDQRIHDTSGFGSQYAQSDCGAGAPALYLPLSRTRWLADQVLASLQAWTDAEVAGRADKIAEVAAFAGYSYVLFGESMCSVAFDEGPEQTTADAFQLAVNRFDQAIAAGGSSAPILNLARVGKARALLNLGMLPEAEAVAAAVPAGFSYRLPYSNADNATRNKVYQLNTRDRQLTVGETYRDVRFAGTPDPRVVVSDLGVNGAGTTIRIWTADKFGAADSPMELASWEEAQLILAEAAVQDGRLQDAVDIITALHSNVGLPPFASSDADEIRLQIIYERAAEFFLEGHHLQDIKRLNVPLYPPTGSDLPFGGFYGAETCFELPAIEFLNNPSIGG